MLFSDNRGAIKLAENSVFYNWSKHIDVTSFCMRSA